MQTIKILLRSFSIVCWLAVCSCSARGTPSLTPTVPPSLIPVTPTLAGTGCSAISVAPTPNTSASAFSAVTSADFSLGPVNAPVTMVEYCDFQTPICLSMAAVASNLIHTHPADIRFVFRPVPIQPASSTDNSHDKSQLAVQAVLAANEQGHFWEMYDALFQKNEDWASLTPSDFRSWLDQQGSTLGLDPIKFRSALTSPDTLALSKSMFDSAIQAGLQSLPLLLLNGRPQPLFALDYSTLNSTIGLIALGARQYKSCPPYNINSSSQYIASLHTAKGDIVIQLYADRAPLAVNSFVFLAHNGWFNGVTFTKVIPGFIAQAGDPSGTGTGGPGYFFNDEINPGLQFDKPGVVGMANTAPNTNGSQFFITFTSQPTLNGLYTIFGQVIQGMNVVDSLMPRDPSTTQILTPGDSIISITIQEK